MRRTITVLAAVLMLAVGVWMVRPGGPAARSRADLARGLTDTARADTSATRAGAEVTRGGAPAPATLTGRSEPASHSDNLLYYAITTAGGGRFPAPGTTEIFALDITSDSSRPVFSDAGLRIVLQVSQRGGTPVTMLVAAGDRIFAPAFIRGARPSGDRIDPSRFYELSVDGSNRAREVFTIRGYQAVPRNVFVSPNGDKLGYINSNIAADWYGFIHDTETGALLDSIALQPILLDAFVRNIGWTPDGERLFMTDESGDADLTSEESARRVGTYLMNADGSDPQHLPAAVDSATTRPGFYSQPDTPPTMLGVMPDGRYLFDELQFERQPSRSATLYQLVDPETGEHTDITPPRAAASKGAFLWSKLSPDGRYLAFTETDPDKQQELLRILDTRSGEARTVLTRPVVDYGYPVMTLIGW